MPDSQIHFVVSAPRSGSTWLCQALNHHPEIFATEHRLFGNYCEVWQNRDGSRSPRMTFDSYAEVLAGHYFHAELGMNRAKFLRKFQRSWIRFLTMFAARHSGKNIVVDKITPYPGTAGFVVSQIRELLPDSKIIQLVRDGRDVVTSGTFDWLQKDATGTPRHALFVERKPGLRIHRFFDNQVLTTWSQNWNECQVAFADQPADLRVSYEAMIDDQAAELGKICAILGADACQQVTANCASQVTFSAMTGRANGEEQPTSKARKGIVGDWQNYFTTPDARLFDQIAGQSLLDGGYESNRNWIENCPSQLELIC